MDGGEESVCRCFPAMKESRQGARWIIEAVSLAKAIKGSEFRRVGESAGAVSALAGPREALILYAQGEAGQRTAAASEDGGIRGLPGTAEEAGKVAGACDVAGGGRA